MVTPFDARLHEGNQLLQQNRLEEARVLFGNLLAEQGLGTNEQGRALTARGVSAYHLHRFDEAATCLEKALEVFHVSLVPSLAMIGRATSWLARVRVAQEALEQGCAMGRTALKLLELSSDATEEDLAGACFFLSSGEYQLGRLDAAETLTMRALRMWEQQPGMAFGVSTCLNNLGRIYEERGDLDTGIAFHRQSVAIRRKLLGVHVETAFSLGNLGTALAAAGYWDEAAETLKDCLEQYAQAGSSDGRQVEGYRQNLAVCLKAKGLSGVS